MMVMVRGGNDLDHEVNGQYGDAEQGRTQENFHFTGNSTIGSLLFFLRQSRQVSVLPNHTKFKQAHGDCQEAVKKFPSGRSEQAENEGPIPASTGPAACSTPRPTSLGS